MRLEEETAYIDIREAHKPIENFDKGGSPGHNIALLVFLVQINVTFHNFQAEPKR